jgi:hypothetical protein
VAKFKKKRARELQHDRFRDTAMTLFDRFGDRLEGRGKVLLYGLGGIVLIAVLTLFFIRWNHRKTEEARQALGRAISIATAPVSPAGSPTATGPSFTSDQARAQKAVEEFQKVAAKYGEPYRSDARYLGATSLLSTDRNKAIAELTELSKDGTGDVPSLAKFALAS